VNTEFLFFSQRIDAKDCDPFTLVLYKEVMVPDAIVSFEVHKKL